MRPVTTAKAALFAALYLFVVGPATFIVLDSVNSATSFPSPFERFTLAWYAKLLGHQEFLGSMKVSAAVAAAAALIATLLGGLAAYGLSRWPVRGRTAVETFLFGPLLVPQIVIGLAMLQLFGLLGIKVGFAGLVLVHAVYVMPFALRLTLTSLARFDFTLEDAARSLGAGRVATLWHVTLPLARTGLVAGFTFAFILSFVNLPVSLFLTSPQTATLPIVMFAYMESRMDPLVTAVASVVVLAAIALTVTLEKGFRLRLMG